MRDSLWFTTRSALFRGGDAGWEAVAAYAAPLERLLARRYPWVRAPEREDLVQDLLLEVHQTLAARHDPGRGPFRALLQAVVRRRVVDLVRRRSPAPLEDEERLVAPPEAELDALDVEASLVEAMAACRDRFTQGDDADPDVLYALADRVVHGRSSDEIAAQDGVSVDRVNRLLRRGRDELFRQLLARELEVTPDDPALRPAVGAFREALRRPTEARALVERQRDPRLRERLDEFLARFRAGVARFAGQRDAGGELQRGIAFVLEDR
ncbi:MAG: hypothetical protein M9894_13915 [Planctomycetes bacterium]|nr:hypothetical protein [Planctomycetota bacterium]